MLPRLRGVRTDHEHVGLLRQTAGAAATIRYGLLAVFSLAIIERPGETVRPTFKGQMRRRIAKGQGGRLQHFPEFEISVREAVQRIEKFGVLIGIEHAVRKDFIDPSVQGPDDRLIANLDVRGQPFLKELDFRLVDTSVCSEAAR
ncbi:hypothetical protein MPLA_2130141 [Mesorhizobium sp. ORS 3359]|nr:hypothetical protein MPLA_2130141 [Mesorhizobium sp. ORS 3359]